MEARHMTDREPIETTNLDIYGHDVFPWSRAHEQLAGGEGPGVVFLGTTRPDGRSHAAGTGAIWHDGDFYMVIGPGTRKGRNLEGNPACTLACQVTGLDLVFEGEAARVTDASRLEALAARYRDQGWPVQVEGDAFTAPYSAPSAGPPPWNLYRVTYHTVFGVGTEEPHGATRWRFGS
jgi:hypothetical protein